MQQNICPNCKTSLQDILESGSVGCAYCYTEFEEELSEIIKKTQKNQKNCGKNPKILKIIDNMASFDGGDI